MKTAETLVKDRGKFFNNITFYKFIIFFSDRREKRAESRERSPERDRSRSPPRKERSRSPSYDRKSPSSPPPGTR